MLRKYTVYAHFERMSTIPWGDFLMVTKVILEPRDIQQYFFTLRGAKQAALRRNLDNKLPGMWYEAGERK